MKVKRKVVIYADRQALELVTARLEAIPSGGWSRDREAEQHLTPWRNLVYCFRCISNGECSPFLLLLRDDGSSLTIDEIEPRDTNPCIDQYNPILIEFFLKFLHPTALDLRVTFDLSSEALVGWRGAQLLRSFSLIAKGSLTHPANRNRWLEFIVYLHSHPERDYGLNLIECWLSQEGWSA